MTRKAKATYQTLVERIDAMESLLHRIWESLPNKPSADKYCAACNRPLPASLCEIANCPQMERVK